MGNVKYSDTKTSNGWIKFNAIDDVHEVTFNGSYEYIRIVFVGEFELYLNGKNEKIVLDFYVNNNEFELYDIAISSLKIIYKGQAPESHRIQYIVCR